MNYRLIAFVFGEICVLMGALMCIPLFMALGYHESHTIAAYGIAIAVCVALGGIGLALRPPKDKRDLRPSSGFAICGLVWIIISLIGAMPYCISGAIPSYVDALFETISGFTTTGSSILTNVEIMPKSLLFWRALT
ncbi:MAG: TrkH family potassium uptake protein, partial [Bacteroides sp.]|nr:TrkH family potassium uptake protein [Bacteroides sp.]